MKYLSTHHCHTQYSDGANSISEMIDRAKMIGFKTIGFSDHLVLHPTLLKVDWSMNIDQIENYICEIRKYKTDKDIEVKLGLEVDFFPNNPRNNELEEILSKYDFDFLIGSVHYINEFPLDYLKSDWEVLSQKEIDKIHISYWENIKLMAETNKYSIIGHIDLPKKLGFMPSLNLSNYINDAILAIKASNAMVEINTAGAFKACKEIYPSTEILNQCKDLGIKIIVNDDAHTIDELGQYYKQLEELEK